MPMPISSHQFQNQSMSFSSQPTIVSNNKGMITASNGAVFDTTQMTRGIKSAPTSGPNAFIGTGRGGKPMGQMAPAAASAMNQSIKTGYRAARAKSIAAYNASQIGMPK